MTGSCTPATPQTYSAATLDAQFDADWYVRNNPDVQQTGADPVDHFITYGIAERRAPNEMMDALRTSAAFHSAQTP